MLLVIRSYDCGELATIAFTISTIFVSMPRTVRCVCAWRPSLVILRFTRLRFDMMFHGAKLYRACFRSPANKSRGISTYGTSPPGRWNPVCVSQRAAHRLTCETEFAHTSQKHSVSQHTWWLMQVQVHQSLAESKHTRAGCEHVSCVPSRHHSWRSVSSRTAAGVAAPPGPPGW